VTLSEGRLPPGQKWVDKITEYAVLGVPKVDIGAYRLRVRGEILNPLEFDLDQVKGMSDLEMVDDLHCVEGWSVRGVRWKGIPLRKIVDLAGPKVSATHVFFRCLDGYSTTIPIDETRKGGCLLATFMNGRELEAELGFPVRLVVPGLYAWKYAKWVSEIIFMDHYEPGYWERRGYHPRGDVWKEERRE